MMIEKQIGRTLAGAPNRRSQETPFGAADVLTLALIVGLVGFCVALTFFMIASI